MTASATVSPADKLIDLVYAVKAGYRSRAVWLMNSQTAGTIRKLKDADRKYIWAESIEPNMPSRLLGYPVVIEEGMPAFASNEYQPRSATSARVTRSLIALGSGCFAILSA